MRLLRKVFKQREVGKLAEPVEIPDVSFPPPVKAQSSMEEIEKTSESEETALQDSLPEPEAADTPDTSLTAAEEIDAELAEKMRECEESCAAMRSGAEADSAAILKEAQSQAADILKRAEQERQSAYKEGLARGEEQKTAEADKILSALAENIAGLRTAQEEFFEDYSKKLALLAADIAEKILADKIASDDLALLPLVKSTLKTMRDADYITVTVAEKHTALIERLKSELPVLNMDKYTEIAASRDLPDDGVLVEAADCAVDASLSRQFSNLRDFLSGQV